MKEKSPDLIGFSDFKIPILKIPPLKKMRNPFGEMIHYREIEGSTDALVIIVHGMGGDSRYLTQLALHVSQKTQHTVVLPDLKFHGEGNKEKSVALKNHENIVMELDFLTDNIKQRKNLSKVILVGHSLGGAVVIQWLLQRPQNIFLKILLISPYLPDPYNVESASFPFWVKRDGPKLKLQFPEQARWGSEVEEYDETYIRACLPESFTFEDCLNLCSSIQIVASDTDQILDIQKYRNHFTSLAKLKLIELSGFSHIGLVTSPDSARQISELI